MNPIRVGILGCAKVVGWGLMDHRQMLPDVAVLNIASRDPNAARVVEAAEKYNIPKRSSYEKLIDDPDIEAVYIPLPNAMHAEWSIRALQAGKAVICEKPLASNSNQAAAIARVVEQTGLPFIEAVHYRYHPLAHRLSEVVANEEIGRIEHIDMRIHLRSSYFDPTDIRYSYELAGGSAMDPGFYCVNVARLIAGSEPEVMSATPELINPDVDRSMVARLAFANGPIADLSMSMAKDPQEIRLVLTGTEGRLETTNLLTPHFGHTWTIQRGDVGTHEEFDMTPTFVFQWREIGDVIRHGRPIRTPVSDGVANLRVTDEIYLAAGMRTR